ncbi:NF038122 family metalloprotease [Acidiphilium sp.]|uniref:NF038122 family metalloprotease n=1 Tax=Acidiphilium sp. TaxID=527 RepID=UPI003D054F45
MSGVTNLTTVSSAQPVLSLGVTLASPTTAPPAPTTDGHMVFDLISEPGTTLSSQAQTALTAAAQYLGALIQDPVTITIGVAMTDQGANGDLATGTPGYIYALPLAQVEQHLTANDPALASVLPATLPSGVYGQVFVSASEEKAWGLPTGNSNPYNGSITFNSFYTTNANYGTAITTANANPSEEDFVGVALHELTHALGRVTDNVSKIAGLYEFGPLNLFRFTAPGTLEIAGADFGGGSYSAALPYFSTNDGLTALETFAGPSHADWNAAVSRYDALNLQAPLGFATISANDVTMMNALGFAMVAPGTAPALPATITATLASDLATVLGGGGSYQATLNGGNAVTISGSTTAKLADLAGTDTIIATGSASVFGFNAIGYAGQIDFINASSAPVSLVDNEGSVTMSGGAGGGTVTGGTAGNNSIIGGSGALFATGGGTNSLVIVNSAQTNYLFAGVGNETLIANPGTGTNLFDCNPGAAGDLMIANGAGTQYFFGSAGTATITGSTIPGATNIFFMGSSLGGASAVVTNFGQITGTIDTTDNAVIQSVANTTYAGAAGALITLNDGTRITLLGVQSNSLTYTIGGTSVT